MKRKLLSLAGAIGALSVVIAALTFLTGKLGSFIRAMADEWRALKASENVQEMGGDIAHGATLAWHALALISWQAWAALGFGTILVSWCWSVLIVEPRKAERLRIHKELAGRFSRASQPESRTDRDDA